MLNIPSFLGDLGCKDLCAFNRNPDEKQEGRGKTSCSLCCGDARGQIQARNTLGMWSTPELQPQLNRLLMNRFVYNPQ